MKYIKWIWNHLMMIRSGFQLAIVLLILESFFGVASVYVQKYIIDDLFMQQKFELLPVLLSIYAVIFICSAILFVATPYVCPKRIYHYEDHDQKHVQPVVLLSHLHFPKGESRQVCPKPEQ
ncbi:ABC transporter ATP-binding protein [Paenibacillus zanthoxyli]|uniref:ABC transporter ATP-binding protein n=1 Tax=Paenibacillus zanthoxyli TaxID=369399 RepID=UPI0004720C7A|nr:ABC transporter ATP-binding protein [Paenibacillus zanthoxyli]